MPYEAWTPETFSVVLPCAGEGEYALKTVQAVHATTPAKHLKEIIVVDDGSKPALKQAHITQEVREKYGVKLVRHKSTLGLIASKQDGGDAATGDVVVFFDCHVAPQPGWHTSFLRLMSENYRRIVVPVITDLDIDTWQQRGRSGGPSACYVTWDADFKWFQGEDEFVPVLSGGLLAMSKRWWNETGGYDSQMSGWGGENVDQSLRTWLCGGEIVAAKDAFVAHMWRRPDDPRTASNYALDPGDTMRNRARAGVAWFGEFSEKLRSFPLMRMDQPTSDGLPWYGDISSYQDVQRRLQCRSFAWYMQRFKHIFEDGGLIPSETFLLRAGDSDLCLAYWGYPGTAPTGTGTTVLRKCNPSDERQRWHGANRDRRLPGAPCCSGLRAWNTDQCFGHGVDKAPLKTAVCDITGKNPTQMWSLNDAGELTLDISSASKSRIPATLKDGVCVEAHVESKAVEVMPCRTNKQPTVWSKYKATEPVEAKLYREATSA
eukprot:gnl/TRDRNA2_/TRDRNA2_85681_c0_seq1.p1 gnl/TRDRNA2_/TRDRNA2_85681_c0~~gnl/TRDRNA2_/TRDRNA2_85681_c0_seq1.p1  ORF type:complete len:535 (-),score=82.34 gnl/TRDRNA2_/TRDRNA2_85681_c0_seq1:78-1544(-)